MNFGDFGEALQSLLGENVKSLPQPQCDRRPQGDEVQPRNQFVDRGAPPQMGGAAPTARTGCDHLSQESCREREADELAAGRRPSAVLLREDGRCERRVVVLAHRVDRSVSR